MKKLNVVGMGNGLVDILVKVSEPLFSSFAMTRGSAEMVDELTQMQILDSAGQSGVVLASAGSVANSIIALAQLGGRGGFLTSIGDDSYGTHFRDEFVAQGIVLPNLLRVGKMTGTVAVLITPDGERTMRFHLGAAQYFGPDSIHEDTIRSAEWLFIEGYLFSNPPSALEGIKKAVYVARESGTKVALTLSEPWVLANFGEPIKALLPQVDLVFANEAESCALTGGVTAEDSFKRLKTIVPECVVTAGAEGVFVRFAAKEFHTPAFPCTPVDLTGAGDMLAGAFLYGVTNGMSPEVSARGGCRLAREVISQVGPRLAKGTKDFWAQALAA